MNITAELVGFIILVMGVVSAAWFRVESSLSAVKREMSVSISIAQTRAELVAVQLSEYKLHVAETYVSKSGLREQTEQIMGAIKDVAGSLAHLNERIDRVIEDRPAAVPRRIPTKP